MIIGGHRRQQGGNKMVTNVQVNEGERDAYENELGHTQTCPPRVNMIKVINQLQTHKGRFSLENT